jgi:hypothetical protein
MRTIQGLLSILVVFGGTVADSIAQPLVLFRERVRVVNMIPNIRSSETNQDSEPNIAVDPQNPDHIVGSAFTPNPAGTVATAPVFVSRDGGLTWNLRNTVPSNNGSTGDISLAFASQDSALYTGILRGGFGGATETRMQLLRTTDAFGTGVMTVLVTRDTCDQPYPTAITTGSGASRVDRVYYANNDLGASKTPRTATIDQSQNTRTAAAPAGIAPVRIEKRTPLAQDMPPVRVAVHGGGRTYAAYYQRKAASGSIRTCDVIVVRDDNFGTSAPAYAALSDPSDGVAGRIVASNIALPFSGNNPWLGQNRGAAGLSIAVNPTNSSDVWIAFCDSVNRVTIHVRRSTDGGANWSADLLTVNSAMIPSLAISSMNVVGVLYQKLNGTTWETHVQRSVTGTSWSDKILATFTDNNPAFSFHPYLGDYCDMVSEGGSFYGVFSSGNIPDSANFPHGVVYQRNANFTTRQLRNTANTANVSASIDPFFFAITPGRLIRICDIIPSLCRPTVLEPGIIRVKCLLGEECVFPELIPEICTKVINCPGCEGGTALCPPFVHFFLDDFDPAVWEVEILDPQGNAVRQELRRTREGVVISFRPSKELYSRKDGIGPYKIAFAPVSGKGDGKEYTFKPRLEVSDYPYLQHVKYGAMKR